MELCYIYIYCTGFQFLGSQKLENDGEDHKHQLEARVANASK